MANITGHGHCLKLPSNMCSTSYSSSVLIIQL